MPTTVVWLRHSLRLSDHAALTHAAERGAVVPLFIWAPDEEGDWPPGGAHRWWLRQSLEALGASLGDAGSRLIVRKGPSLDALRDIAETTGADRVVWQTRYEPAMRARDAEVAEALGADGVETRQFAGRILHDPDSVRTGSGGPYKVFGPFFRKMVAETAIGEPLPAPDLSDAAPAAWPDTLDLDALPLTAVQQDGVDWAETMRDTWAPGEAGANARLQTFLDEALLDYDDLRNVPGDEGTSRLSPHLHWGEISPRQAWAAADAWVTNGATREAADKFLSELGWREFSYHVLHHYPETPSAPLKEKYAAFEWSPDADLLAAWQRGQTGYPIVDAGMRQLWAEGWMHNRVRMITGSFLTKDLLQPWQDGAAWFWDTLCGGDLANNSMGWQWVAGSGADAQPFFRVFNPVSQSKKHDPDGAYLRRWLPELAELPTKHLHAPWAAPEKVLADAGVTLGETYPDPVVWHADQREEALRRLKAMNDAAG